MEAKAAAKRIFGKVIMGFSFRRAGCPLVCHKKGLAADLAVRESRSLTRRGWDTRDCVLDAETRRGGERRGEERGGMEGGGFSGSARWGAEEEEEDVRASLGCTRRSLMPLGGTQGLEGGGGSGVGARSLSGLGCVDGGRFCDAKDRKSVVYGKR